MSNNQVLEGQVIEQNIQPAMNVDDLLVEGSIFCKLKENYFSGYYEVYYIIVKTTPKFVTARPLEKKDIKTIKEDTLSTEYSFKFSNTSSEKNERFGKSKLKEFHFKNGNELYEFDKEYKFTRDKQY